VEKVAANMKNKSRTDKKKVLEVIMAVMKTKGKAIHHDSY